MTLRTTELDDIEAGLTALHRAMFQYRAWESLQRAAGIDLDRASATLLKTVAHQRSRCRMQDVAELLGIEAPSVSRTVHQLRRSGYLHREPDTRDRRASNLSLTNDGKALLAKLQKARRERLSVALASWPSEERAQLAHLLQKFGDSIAKSQQKQEFHGSDD